MTRTTKPTTKAERDEWRINGWGAHGFPERLLDDADAREELMQTLGYEGEMHANAVTLYKQQIDALRQRVAVLEGAIQAAMKQANHRWSEWGERAEGVADILDAALSFSPPAPPNPNADKVTCRRCGIKVDASECVGESADPDSEPVCYGCQFTLLVDERDRFQRLAKFYDAQIRENVAKTIVEREPDGSPCWAGRAPTLHLIRVCDEHVKFAEIVRRAVELAQAVDDFCGGLIGGANWTDHTGRVADMTRLNDAVRIAEMILRDAAALRAGAERNTNGTH